MAGALERFGTYGVMVMNILSGSVIMKNAFPVVSTILMLVLNVMERVSMVFCTLHCRSLLNIKINGYCMPTVEPTYHI